MKRPAAPLTPCFKGVPLVVNFAQRLSQATFDRWVNLTFKEPYSFRLWGDPIRLGPTKVHVYGVDRDQWQPIHLEMTAERLVAILPKGACGKTFEHLVANVQRYVCPRVEVWLGDKPFAQVVSEQAQEAVRGDPPIVRPGNGDSPHSG
jgi:hypothetical protein